ncbi:hypothetical protein [Sphingomonas sp. KC8]|uniref:hypothetical protein n=1 Tax=Sphingomonas sp. KC8 TaxID=1030157 RepID=UPI000248A387|nr:hypothetical protein [Sphingomonas sp. KC8]ARS28012.1 hypothetical protein KC8_12035 [Sphingomonas sp. KC8]
MGWLAALLLAQATVGGTVPADMAAVAGRYDGSRMEMGAELELAPDGRFQYALAYGALDEVATGRWRVADGAVILDSDPVRAPAYRFIDRGTEKSGRIVARLIVPKGMEPQYFSFVLLRAGDRPIERQVGYGGNTELAYDPAYPPTEIRLMLPIYDLISPAFPLDLAKAGRRIEVAFTPNDLGRVAFADTHLPIVKDGLRFERFGATILFRKR